MWTSIFKSPSVFPFFQPSPSSLSSTLLFSCQRAISCHSGCTPARQKLSLQLPSVHPNVCFNFPDKILCSSTLPSLSSCCFTLPAVVADAEFLSGQVTVAVIRAATVVSAVRDVAGLSFPVLLTLTVNATGDRVRRAASAVARAVVGTRVYPEGDAIRQRVQEVLQGYTTP